MEEIQELKQFPPITKDDLWRANRLFTTYLFYQSLPGAREFWCTCCGRHWTLEELPRTSRPQERELMAARHGDEMACPYCRTTATVKNLGMSKTRKNMEEWRNIGFLHVRKDQIFVQMGYVRKRYADSLQPELEVMPKACYLFQPGQGRMWKYKYDYTYLGLVQERWVCAKTVHEAFPGNFYSYNSHRYQVIGMERLAKSWARYCAYPLWIGEKDWQHIADRRDHERLMHYLDVYARYPQIELMVKLGVREPVRDLIYQNRKNVDVIKWKESDPRKAFGLDGRMLKEWIAVGAQLDVLRLYHLARQSNSRTTMQEVKVFWDSSFFRTYESVQSMDLWKALQGSGITVDKAMGYMRSKVKKKAGLHEWEVLGTWKDYLEAAKLCGYDMTNRQVLMPRDLMQAHDMATENAAEIISRQGDHKLDKRAATLTQRYGYEDAQFLIRPPHAMLEITHEGKVLRHCVGTYAAKHAKGQTNILFLRRKSEPWKPFYTIEVIGETLIQCRTLQNRSYTTDELVKQFVDRWVEEKVKRKEVHIRIQSAG